MQANITSRNSMKSGDVNGDYRSYDLQFKKGMDEEIQERESIVLWKRPITTVHYFLVELLLNIQEYALK